jgi:hypothetical protein
MHALRLTLPQPWLPIGTVFHRAGQTGGNPSDVTRAKPDPFVCPTGTPAEFIRGNGRPGPTPPPNPPDRRRETIFRRPLR